MVYRIARRQFIDDLTGEGARRFGGRWNRKGVAILYTSESRSLATVEYLVHLSMGILAPDLAIAALDIPSGEPVDAVDPNTLPPDWNRFPAPADLADRGSSWQQGGSTLGLRVPSAVVKGEWNLLLNPHHPAFAQVRVVSVEDFVLDQRLSRGR